jgi:hypothetical protein
MKKPRSSTALLVGFVLVNLGGGAFLLHRFFRGDRTFVVPGAMTRGHFPIESQCEQCHTPGLGVRPDACMKCHRRELERSDDTHPPSKFTDPRNADRLAKLDARSCVACHMEHRPEITRAEGVTRPADFCENCHADVAKDRPSHQGFAFTACANTGCHHFHDNRALHEDFLARHLSEAPLLVTARVPAETRGTQDTRLLGRHFAAGDADALGPSVTQALLLDWAATAHARARVNCGDCHRTETDGWTERPGIAACRGCHGDETQDFLASKHGMRLAVGLPPMTPSLARLPMRPEAAHESIGCASCHPAHRFERRRAAVDACLGCHDDEHSRAYKASRHFALWQAELAGQGPPGSGVSCATCHLPRETPVEGTPAVVRHDQSAFIRPDEKMVGVVCTKCHGLGFSLDAVADPACIRRGVDGAPSAHVASLEMVQRRATLSLDRPDPQ